MTPENTIQEMREVEGQHKSSRLKSVHLDSKDCYAEVYKTAKSRCDKRLLAAAMSALHKDFRAWRREESMAEYWLDPSAPPTHNELRTSGGREAVLEVIRRGDLVGTCGVWTGDFWAGLRDSGILRPKTGRSAWSWRVRLEGKPELAKDMEETEEVLISVSKLKDSWGRRIVRSESSLLPESSGPTPGWLAGLLSGMDLVERLGVWVLEMKRLEPRVLNWLKESGVWHCGALGGGLWISPFYLPLVSRHSPMRSGERWKRLRGLKRQKIIGGDWIPLSTWEIVFGHEIAGKWPDRAWGLPWAPGHATRTRMGIDRRKAHMIGVSRGIGEPAPWLKELCKEWRRHEEIEES